MASLLSPKIGNRKNYVVLTSIEGCVKDLEQVVDPEVIKGLPADKLSKTYMKAYDLDSNQ